MTDYFVHYHFRMGGDIQSGNIGITVEDGIKTMADIKEVESVITKQVERSHVKITNYKVLEGQ